MASNQPERMIFQTPRDAVVVRTYLTDMDKVAVEAIGERFGSFIPADRLKKVPDIASKFESSHELRKAYREETGHKASDRLAGFTTADSPAQISVTNMSCVPETILHERIHQLASPDAKRLFGDKLYEGMTQDLAIEVLGQEPQAGDLTGYPVERDRAHNVRKLLGTEAVCRAYFQGDAKALQTAIDRVMRERPLAGSQDKIRELPPLE
jgi:hypothetical protein